MEALWMESEPRVPLICFLSMGSDPTEIIERLAKSKSLSMNKLHHFYSKMLYNVVYVML